MLAIDYRSLDKSFLDFLSDYLMHFRQYGLKQMLMAFHYAFAHTHK